LACIKSRRLPKTSAHEAIEARRHEPAHRVLGAVDLNTDALKVDVTERMRATGPFDPGDIEPVNERPSSSAVLRKGRHRCVVLID
jgi:hypothetical protein